jgi:dephospho-CoA kinase
MGKNVKLCLIGSARWGKDSLAEIFNEQFGLKYTSSSEACADIFIYDKLKDLYGYTSVKECFNDRFKHRAEWFNLISEYNKDDKARLAKEIMKNNDIYVGMRSRDEIEECLRQNVFNLVIWVDGSKRLPFESKDSFDIDSLCADIIIENNDTYENFQRRAINLGNLLFK